MRFALYSDTLLITKQIKGNRVKKIIIFLLIFINHPLIFSMESSESPDLLYNQVEKDACWLAQGSGVNGKIDEHRKNNILNALEKIGGTFPSLKEIHCHPSYRIVLKIHEQKDEQIKQAIAQINPNFNYTLQPYNKKFLSVVFSNPVDLISLENLYKKIDGILSANRIAVNPERIKNNISVRENNSNLIFKFTQIETDIDHQTDTTIYTITYNPQSNSITQSTISHE
ncbi:MAG: hypothetical protein BWY54_00225 [Candidatus Dependentiae bacterium ADurb.Bin331]|nr:MAG: hypothetical protein BWY54_00225 [Candidatus Dependentiae bacterium ADurb.Bin331]